MRHIATYDEQVVALFGIVLTKRVFHLGVCTTFTFDGFALRGVNFKYFLLFLPRRRRQRLRLRLNLQLH